MKITDKILKLSKIAERDCNEKIRAEIYLSIWKYTKHVSELRRLFRMFDIR